MDEKTKMRKPKIRFRKHLNRYDEQLIDLKQECREGCEFYRHIGGSEYCGGGKWYQIIFETKGKKLKRCGTRTLILKGEVKEHSVEVIDNLILNLAREGFLMKNTYGGIGIR